MTHKLELLKTEILRPSYDLPSFSTVLDKLSKLFEITTTLQILGQKSTWKWDRLC